jgi:hypothetical protein
MQRRSSKTRQIGKHGPAAKSCTCRADASFTANLSPMPVQFFDARTQARIFLLRAALSNPTWRPEDDSFNGKPKASAGRFVLRVRRLERRAHAVAFGLPLNELD